MAEEQLERLRDDSDALLEKMRELTELESLKRRLEVSTPPFHDAADAVADKSREIFTLAHDEQLIGNQIDERQGLVTEDISPDR
jgi:hypothetical protein